MIPVSVGQRERDTQVLQGKIAAAVYDRRYSK